MLLETRTVEKPWGKDALPAPFDTPAGKRIGEIWFEPPRDLPQLLVKYIFTSEKLSVQVHPSDAQTEVAGLGKQGKEECWLVIAAEPEAKLGIGFERAVDAETMRAAALDGSIEDMLAWHPAGDVPLVEGPWFRVDQVDGLPSGEQARKYHGCLLVIPRTGTACVEDEPVLPGQCALAHSIDEVVFDPQGSCLIAQPCPAT